MNRKKLDISGQKGFALVYMAATLTVLLLFSGLAVDSGRAYVVKAELTKAVDGAALAAARNLNTGNPRGEATRIFKANFPVGYMGTSATDPTTDPGFFSLTTDVATGVNVVTVTASATMPTTFMKLGNFYYVTVTSSGEATRRMVDLSLVLDVSGSIGPAWSAVRDASRTFISAFDELHDRLSLSTFSYGAQVLQPMPSTRGFNKSALMSAVPNTLPGGNTNMAEGLYRAWDEVKSVPVGTQSGLRIIVLFTDGAPNGVPGFWDSMVTAKSLYTGDFSPGATVSTGGLADTQAGTISPSFSLNSAWNARAIPPTGLPAYAQWMPVMSTHTHHRSPGIKTAFPWQSNTLTVNGVPQNMTRGLRDLTAGKYPSQVWNVNNAARNLAEIIANEARNDVGDYPIRIYTVGMGAQIRMNLGTRPELSEDILKRIANDKTSPDYNPAQLGGAYFFAQTAADVEPAFQGIQNQILRLSK